MNTKNKINNMAKLTGKNKPKNLALKIKDSKDKLKKSKKVKHSLIIRNHLKEICMILLIMIIKL